MATKAPSNRNKRFSLKRSILNVVGRIHSISAEEIRLEIEEDEDRILSRVQVRERLEQLCEHHLLTEVTLPNDKVVYMMDRK